MTLVNENVIILNETSISEKYNNKFHLELDSYTKDSIYDDEPFYDDYVYDVFYNDNVLLVYNETNYPLSVSVEICNIAKRITIFVPCMKETFRNVEIAKEAVEYTKELIYKLYLDTDYNIEVFYDED